MITYTSTLDTPIGPFTIIVDRDGAVLASGWTASTADLLPHIHADLRADPVTKDDLGAATRAAAAYHRGDLAAPSVVPVRQQAGGTFLTVAWKALRDVAPGERVTYTELASRAGNPAAVRAAAQACARNAAALFVPCHRVIRTDGGLGGFRWGLAAKQWLLAHESRS
ncbi:MAG TPA: methylated-DNA--[protein]-cysteine S-methyltransferase [Micromonosporaceae bacterium]|nr:methylated-DNA--[protein]-cysteine S-methyltransferase [Micromonosporaceae bacterium]